MTAQKCIDAQEIRRALSVLMQPGQVIEIRCLNATSRSWNRPHIISGYFTDVEALITAIGTHIIRASGIYITMNPCAPALLNRAVNRLREDRDLETTTDAQIIARCWLPIDCDPHREGNITGIPATESEHNAALQKAREVRVALKSLGWPEPVAQDSGNGAYLFYALDLPAEDGEILKRVLAALAHHFDDARVSIDQKMFNPARIIRLGGTWNCKGDETEERPYRLSHLLHVPEEITQVSQELLLSVIARWETSSPEGKKQVHSTQHVGMHPYVRQAVEDECADVASAPAGTRNPRLNEAAFSLGQFVGGGVLEEDEAEQALAEAMRACGLPESDSKTIRSGIAAGKLKPRTVPENPTGTNGHHVTAGPTDEEVQEDTDETQSQTNVALLMNLCSQGRYFKTPEGELCVSVPINSHREVMLVSDKSPFRRWLAHRFYTQTGRMIGSTTLSQVIDIMAARTYESGETATLFTRVGHLDGAIYLDLADASYQVCKITAHGWQVMASEDCPVYFRRTQGALPLPIPRPGGSLDALRPFLNLPNENAYGEHDEKAWRLVVSFMLMLLHPTGPYPGLALSGEQGSTKSSTTRFIRSVVDPHAVMARSAPREERDVAIAARNNWVFALENLSSMPQWLSDMLATLSTGSGFGKRANYTDDSEALFTAKRPWIINGIGEMVTRGDLLSRTAVLTLPALDESNYQSESDLNAAYAEAHPGILGALLSITSQVLARMPRLAGRKFTSRMAEMEAWITAAEPALGWQSGTFQRDWIDSQLGGIDTVIESSQEARALIQFIQNRINTGESLPWKGSATELDAILQVVMGDKLDKRKWAGNPRALSDALRKVGPALRTKGYSVTSSRSNGIRVIVVNYHPPSSGGSAAKSAVSAANENEVTTFAALPQMASQATLDLRVPQVPQNFQILEEKGKDELTQVDGNKQEAATFAALESLEIMKPLERPFEGVPQNSQEPEPSAALTALSAALHCRVCGISADLAKDFHYDAIGRPLCDVHFLQ